MILDFDKSMPPAGPLYVRVGESGRRVSAQIVDQGVPVDLSGASTTFHVAWRDGAASAACEVDGDVVSWRMPKAPSLGRALSAYVEVELDGVLATTQEIEVLAKEGTWNSNL